MMCRSTLLSARTVAPPKKTTFPLYFGRFTVGSAMVEIATVVSLLASKGWDEVPSDRVNVYKLVVPLGKENRPRTPCHRH